MKVKIVVDRICDLMKRECESVGFIPRPRVHEHVRRGLFQLQIAQGEIVGYMIHGPYREQVSIHQVVVDLDARRHMFASAMEAALTLCCVDNRAKSIRLQCRDDLQANLFWLAAGYCESGWGPAGIKRRFPKTIWIKNLQIDHTEAAIKILANLNE